MCVYYFVRFSLISDPSPNDLIIKFTNAIFDVQKIENKRNDENGDLLSINMENLQQQKQNISIKSVALKMLALKVAAYLKWNLGTFFFANDCVIAGIFSDYLCLLPMKIQVNLLQDLLHFTSSDSSEPPNIYECKENTTKHHLFALVLYHRWLIRASSQQNNVKFQNKYLGFVYNSVIG